MTLDDDPTPTGGRRVLLVDDSEFWRGAVRPVLQAEGRWEIVGEASDGLEAIQKVQTLKPDLVLMDITLPRLNGIEAARRILELGMGTRIVFVTAYASKDIADAALATGAHGYVLKLDAGSQLLRAMEIVAGGRSFVSPQLARHRKVGRTESPH
jgi:DNA-binding NarL/FixJ family response regulator